MASSVLLFREIYPNGKEYEIYSFEIDNRLKPYFAAYKHQSGINVNIPLGVAAKNVIYVSMVCHCSNSNSVLTLKAYAKDVPLTLFVYGDFVEEHPELIKEWSLHYEIGIRGSGPMPNGLWELQNNNLLRLSIVSAMTRLMELKLVAKYILPTGFKNLLTYSSYFEYRDVERIPKALAVIHNALADKGGILSLDSDFPDSYTVSTFLMDYLYKVSDHTIVGLRRCLTDNINS
ncbi:uncharacterized protein LOC144347648 [Saccoglossus kowalevskii]